MSAPTPEDIIDVDRLTRAMRWAGVHPEPDFATIEEAAAQVAADYDRLGEWVDRGDSST